MINKGCCVQISAQRGSVRGARPASRWIIAIKNVRQDFLTSAARFFVKLKLHEKCGVIEA